LGLIELSDHESCTNNLGHGNNCAIRFDATPEKAIDIHFVFGKTDANGEVKQLATTRIITFPGNKVNVLAGDAGISFIAKLKTN